ncbi:MAG: (d)CMP kinase [Planctomycetota bacterium]
MTGAPAEVVLPRGTLAVGDLHVDVAAPTAVSGLLRFLAAQHGRPCLVVLGDLFEYWIGRGQARSEGGVRALAALRELAASGTRVLVVPGNRDFLLGADDERAGGFELRPDGFVGVHADGARTLVLHGDELCTLDRPYQRLRRVVRSVPVRVLARLLPVPVSEAIARRLRAASKDAVARKPPESKRPQRDEALRRARAAGAGTLLTGHVHEFRDETTEGVRWLCVDAFGDGRDAFELTERGWVATRSADARAGRMARRMTIVAIDGPSGTGKSTVARMLAARLGLFFLDTGAMYRAVTRAALETGVSPEDAEGCERVARGLRLDFDERGALLVDGVPAGRGIRTEHVTRHVSAVSAHRGVREIVVERQREIVDERGGAVAEGRDTTTVVFPHADLKIYLTASAMTRAATRAGLGLENELGRILEEICRRDDADRSREHSPLREAEDAIRVESDGLSAEEVTERLVALAEGVRQRS